MSRFIESIKLKDGQLFLLPYHEERMNRTRRDVGGHTQVISIFPLLKPSLPSFSTGLFKVRVLYDDTIQKIEIHPYTPRLIQSLQLVTGQLDYQHKTTNRIAINNLFAKRGKCDDVLIIKEGWVTDSSYSNVAFFDGQIWWTPDTPLLKGVQRQYLLDQGIIRERAISRKDIFTFQKIKLFNAIMDWADGMECPIREIHGL